MQMLKLKQDAVSARVDRVVWFTDKFCKVANVVEITEDKIVTDEHIFPLADAKTYNGDNGLVYAFNMDLDYLAETRHLAEVEKNMIVQQAFIFPGRNNPNGKTSSFMWVVIGFFFILAMIGMFKH